MEQNADFFAQKGHLPILAEVFGMIHIGYGYFSKKI